MDALPARTLGPDLAPVPTLRASDQRAAPTSELLHEPGLRLRLRRPRRPGEPRQGRHRPDHVRGRLPPWRLDMAAFSGTSTRAEHSRRSERRGSDKDRSFERDQLLRAGSPRDYAVALQSIDWGDDDLTSWRRRQRHRHARPAQWQRVLKDAP